MNAPVELAVRSVALVVDGLVHDLNNPLTILLANLEMVTRRLQSGEPLDEDDHEALAECQHASQRIAGLLRDARRLSRGPTTSRVDDVLAAAVRATKQVARDARVRLAVDVEPDLSVAVDESRAALAVTTLLDALLRRAPSADNEGEGVEDGSLTRPGDVAGLAVVGRAAGAQVVLEFVASGSWVRGVVDDDIVGVALAAVGTSPAESARAVFAVDAERATVALQLPRHLASPAPSPSTMPGDTGGPDAAGGRDP